MAGTLVIGIAGGSGSGKSTLVRRLLDSPVGPRLTLLAHDAYYRNGSDMDHAIRVAENWDHPDALDNPLFIEHLDRLRAGEAIERPVYDFKTHSRTDRTERVEPRPVVLLDGILLLAIREVRERIDLRVYVHTPAEERLIRRISRDVAERGRSLESVVSQFRATVRPMHDVHVEPSRDHAHVVIPWDLGPDNSAAVELLVARVAAFGAASVGA